MEKRSRSAGASIVAGSIAGASETFVTYPAEFAKTRRQLEISVAGNRSASSSTILRSTFQNAGFQGIYAGCQTLAVSNAMKSSIRFFSFETAKRNLAPLFSPGLRNDPVTKSPWLNFAAGLCAGSMESILVVTPGESLKTRVIHDAASGGRLGKMPLPSIVRQVVREHGIMTLWKGFLPVLCKQSTNSAVRFTTFGTLKEKLKQISPTAMSGTMATMIAGAGSGVVTVYASMPFDNIKTRMQSIGNSNRRMVSVAAKMFANEGIAVFWKATTPRLVRLTFSSSVTFMVYDFVLQIWDTPLFESQTTTLS
ncbi:mitochondrial carrier [Corynespora cassiicola Philippines]|uniref:Mitochondrial carrier n=1 Tax=Corynespora cassiicola Philippines TaxID=1448308 RepID=A0A2T2N8Z7_CORCC|nr:mitochondrial carrier [Corynespora cassiicola Philippines]